ncbi:MAG: fumarylacetoacetate hydrolase family protein [Nitrososphaerales archaeon]|nr:fumarylacetoacetate hydrolase family protein [Nitrososphaerales archaeon]
MKLVNFVVDRSVRLGAVVSGQVLDITDATGSVSDGLPSSLEEALGYWDRAVGDIQKSLNLIMSDKSTLQKLARKMKEVRFLPPVRTPGKILCVFVNYRSHGKEVGSAPSEPYFFFKHSGCIVGDGDDVFAPKFSTKVDHEVELGVIIGKKGKDIEQKDAYDYVAGYTVVNDISFRDGMKRGVEGTVVGRNLYKGKVADTSLPMGPFLVTRDEVPDPYPLGLSLKVNGEVRQEGTTDDMIFRVPDLIACASEGNTLLPGDVIATGTCSGVALYTGKYLQDGDLVEAEVEKVGVLKNKIRMQSRGA